MNLPVVTGCMQLAMKRNGYFAFQTIIDVLGRVMPKLDVVYVGSPCIIISSKKILTN